MKKILLLLAPTLCSLTLQAQQKTFDQSLADSLASWTVLDQTAAGPRTGRFKATTIDQHSRYADSVFAANEQRLRTVFNKYGFPGYDLAGKKGSFDFWLMVQHCDKDVPFQEAMLKAMKAEVLKGNASAKDFAYLTDRVLLNTGRRQLYGTQVTYNTDSCQAIPKPLDDSLNVDKRRSAVGLTSLASYLNLMSQMHFEMNKGVYEKKGIHQPKIIAEPKQ